MAGVGGAAAVVSTPSLCRCSAPQAGSVSASRFSLTHLFRPPRKSFPRLRPEISCSSSSSGLSHSDGSLRLFKTRTNARQSSSPSPLYASASHEKSALAEEAVMEPVSTFLLRNLGALWTGSLVVGTAGAALAETFEVPAPSPSEGTSTDYLLSFLFIAAFIGLAVLTIGVIYLGVTDFLENRERKAMQEASREEKRGANGEKKDTVRIGSSKGFGVKKVEKKPEKGK